MLSLRKIFVYETDFASKPVICSQGMFASEVSCQQCMKNAAWLVASWCLVTEQHGVGSMRIPHVFRELFGATVPSNHLLARWCVGTWVESWIARDDLD